VDSSSRGMSRSPLRPVLLIAVLAETLDLLALDVPPAAKIEQLEATIIEHGVNRRAILTRFGVKPASKIDHPVPCAALPTVRGEQGCCAWKRLARFADGGWCRGSRSVPLPSESGLRSPQSNSRRGTTRTLFGQVLWTRQRIKMLWSHFRAEPRSQNA
jgi:hypothetical protein